MASSDKGSVARQRPAIEGGQPVRREPLPFHRPTLGEEEERAVLGVLRSGWLTRGKLTTEFEGRLMNFTGAGHALALNSCTAALELSLVLAGVGPDDEVIVPAMTFAATGNVVAHRFARPVLVDVEPDTLNIDPAAAARAITPRTRAIIAVDMAGHPAEYDDLEALARQQGIALIEDAAHALEARYRGRPVGTLADYTCLSFYANKNITTGEGGALLFRAAGETSERAAVLSLHGMSRHAWNRYGQEGFKHYDVTEAGYKWNMFDMQAALGNAQMDRLEDGLARRDALVERYTASLAHHHAIRLMAPRSHVRHAHHLFLLRLVAEELSVSRDHILDALKAEGIGVAVHYRPLPQLSFYREQLGYDPADFPVAVATGEALVSLPLFPTMTDADVDDVVTALRRILDYYHS